jgi:hypothetical protein
MKHYRHNWYKETGYTLKQAKNLCKGILGRMPKMGYEMTFHTEVKYQRYYGTCNQAFYGNIEYTYCLVNTSGKLSIRVYETIKG